MKFTFLPLFALGLVLGFSSTSVAQGFSQTEFQTAIDAVKSSPKGAQLTQQLDSNTKKAKDLQTEIQQVMQVMSNEASIKRRMLTDVGAPQAQIKQAVEAVNTKYKTQLDDLRAQDKKLKVELEQVRNALTELRLEELRKNPKFGELVNAVAAIIAESKK